MFDWFEKRLDPFPATEPVEPPRTLIAFCLHYTRGAWPYIAATGLLITAIALAEVWMFSFLGRIVDWLSAQNRETFLQTEGWKLAVMAFIVVVVLPGMALLQSLVHDQTLMGNYPMRIRWDVHRYLLKQSMSFYQDEFAGRIATKLMQTALAVRECVVKVIDVLNYVIVYFLGMLVIVGSSDWRLAMPLLGWLVCYGLLLWYYIPRLGRVSAEQADARSVMTGRIVDSYANIQTVKLFSHARREATYARDSMAIFMDTVYRSMRLVTSLYGLLYLLNSLLLFAVAALSIWLWLGDLVSIGAVAVVIGLVLRLWGMSQWIMWEMSALFENIGTVQDGIASISLPRLVEGADKVMTDIADQRIVRPAMTQKMRLQTQFAGDREQVQCRRKRNRCANLRAAMKRARTIEKHGCKHRIAGRRQSFDRAPAARRQLAEPGGTGPVAQMPQAGAISFAHIAACRP